MQIVLYQNVKWSLVGSGTRLAVSTTLYTLKRPAHPKKDSGADVLYLALHTAYVLACAFEALIICIMRRSINFIAVRVCVCFF